MRWGLGETWDPGGRLGRMDCAVRQACRAKRVGLETLEPRASRDRRVMLGWRVNSGQQGSRALLAWPASQVSRECLACLETRGHQVVAVTPARLAQTGRMGWTERLGFLGRPGTVASLERMGVPVSRGCQGRPGPREMQARRVCLDTRDRQENRETPGWWDRRAHVATAALPGLRVTLGKQGRWEAVDRRERWETRGRQASRDQWVILASEDLGVQLGSRAAKDRRACQGCREVQDLWGHPAHPVHLETPSLVFYCVVLVFSMLYHAVVAPAAMTGGGESGVPGSPGPMGPPGPPGERGAGGGRGPEGGRGNPGSAGSPGAPGRQGLPGRAGNPGQPGKNGRPVGEGGLGSSV